MLECSPIDDIAMTLRKMRLNIIRVFAVEDPNTEPSRLLPNRVERIHVAANAADPDDKFDSLDPDGLEWLDAVPGTAGVGLRGLDRDHSLPPVVGAAEPRVLFIWFADGASAG